jgi:hypothetical protein
MKQELNKAHVFRWLDEMYGSDLIEEIYNQARQNVMSKDMYDAAVTFAEDEIRSRIGTHRDQDKDEHN